MSFVTYRRYYLDHNLKNTIFSGVILDIGGKKDSKRGSFRPPLSEVERWDYLNIDKSTNPDIVASADDLPIEPDSYDMIVLAEVLEHLEMPTKALEESFRVLKNKGRIVISMPFLNAIHADPYDYQRWTSYKIKHELSEIGFKDIHIEEMGKTSAVIYDMLRVRFLKESFINRVLYKVLRSLKFLFDYFERKDDVPSITTGYFVRAVKE